MNKQLCVNIEIPLNIMKEKINSCLPHETEIEDDAIKAFSIALEHFLQILAKKIKLDNNDEKKILIKDIKECIELNDEFFFLRKLVEK
jgi:hypothetical protein